ncbi:ATP-binding protein [Beijerinckia sp. L45]|uniref:hybrid sensor histidine kinase/response regulator n=1 Tax=Beijerinckia sp. L45 TaxID=1641855 RepID=UPI00131A7393|nr:ATP-binding protein [Beijerinckia sp. L45]
MVGRQRIDRVRREYNQWVANETLEDFALRFTAKSARRWSSTKVGNTALGAISFLALEAIGGSITLNYGYINATAAIVAVAIVIFLTAVPICFSAAKYGVDIDLLTRGAGFGYIGSTITSLIYASFTFIFFAIESVILAMALELCLGIPRPIGYLISALAVIPLVTYGIAAISRFQVWTQPIWIAMNVVPIVVIAMRDPQAWTEWQAFAGDQNVDGGFHLAMFGAAASVTIALIVQVGEQVDFLRFLPDRRNKRKMWWVALLSAGPGWIVVGALKLFAGSFLAVVALRAGVPRAAAGDPPQMYAIAFQTFASPPIALALTCVFVVVCQLKINVTNAYAGSIAWSNFFSRLTHSHPGRVVWLIFNVLVALLVMELGVYRALEQTLAIYSSVAVAWVGAIVADLVINKPLGLSPPTIEFRRAHLYDINPVGVGAMAIATMVSGLALFDVFGATARALTPFLSLGVSMACVPLIALLTGSKFYLARQPETNWQGATVVRCCICEHSFEPEDMASCPAYAGPICSLCCSLDARCHDMCKPHARLHDQLAAGLTAAVPRALQRFVVPHVVEYILAFLVSIVLIVLTLGMIGLQMAADHRIDGTVVSETLWKVFFSLLIVVAVVSWLFGLVQVSRRAAQNETLRQTQLLMDEIDAHERTDAALKRAKEVAEAANFAKSRYVVGLSHELRTPLNTIMGYAQLLERDQAMLPKPRRQIAVMRRSANHLSGLIDGLLDISKIEAGRLDLSRDEVSVRDFLTQLVDMFAVQAAAKGIEFTFRMSPDLPATVAMDEKRLRQILINLLSNAIKFTQIGRVSLDIAYRNEVAEFVIRDTGPGIPAADRERIFEPFERLKVIGAPEAGTGLGLTICRLLSGVMGGDIKVASEPGVGSAFTLKLFLPRINDPKRMASGGGLVDGPLGRGRTILIIDDDPAHRDMVQEALAPLEFAILCAADGAAGLEIADAIQPDLFLLDIEMPGDDGWQIAEKLRARGHSQAKIVMLSASAMEEYRSAIALPFHDDFIMKPVDITRLTETVVSLLGLQTSGESIVVPIARPIDEMVLALPDPQYLRDLVRHCEIGYVRGLRATLSEISATDDAARPFVAYMLGFVDDLDMRGLMAALERLGTPA